MNNTEEVHIWSHCHNCGACPIKGVRYQCQTCTIGPDTNLCASCFSLFSLGKVQHPPPPNNTSFKADHKFLVCHGETPDLYRAWFDIEIPNHSAPAYERGFIVRPEFRCGYSSYFGGYGFIVKTTKGMLFLTALHVLDEVIRNFHIDASIENSNYTGKELSVIDKVNLYDALEHDWMFHQIGICKTLIILPEARIGIEEPKSDRDINAFFVERPLRHNLNPGSLAIKSPDIGQPVWLAARSTSNCRIRKAVVIEKTDRSLVYRYESSKPLPKYCSGAPVLNGDGDVVGINIGAGFYESRRFGHANTVENIRNHLTSINS